MSKEKQANDAPPESEPGVVQTERDLLKTEGDDKKTAKAEEPKKEEKKPAAPPAKPKPPKLPTCSFAELYQFSTPSERF